MRSSSIVISWAHELDELATVDMATQQASDEALLPIIIENTLPPEGLEGIKILKCEADGKVYVIDEVLNYYQRKLSDLTIDQMRLLPHHMFEADLLIKA